MIVRRRRLASVLLVSALALAACSGGDDDTPGAAAGQTLKIGLLTPKTGANADTGGDAERGARLAVAVINGLNPSIPLPLAAGAGLPNLGGAKVSLVVEDAAPRTPGSEQVTAGDAVNRLVSGEGVDALIGAYDAQVTEYASQRSERFEVPFVNADSPATFLTDAGRDWFFRIGPDWRSAGEAFFSLLRGRGVSPGKMLVLNADDKAGQDVVTTISNLSQESGSGAVQNVRFNPAAANLQGAVNQMIAADPDTVFMYVTPASFVKLNTAIVGRAFKPPAAISFSLGFVWQDVSAQEAAAADGLLRAMSWSAEAANRNPAAQAIAELYQQKYNRRMTEAAANAFTAVMTVAQAADNAGSTENQAIRTALLSLNVSGEDTIMPWSGIRFDETHQNVLAQSIVEQFFAKERVFKIVFPVDAASDRMVWPAPGSSPGAGAAAG